MPTNLELTAEITRLKKINNALITRIEAGPDGRAAYDSFAHSVFLADKVRDRTTALNEAIQELAQSNRELALAQAAAELANASRAKLMTAISHDIMQPVCAAQLVLANLLTNEATEKTTTQIVSASSAIEDIEHLLQGLLDYARDEVSDTPPELVATNISELLCHLTAETTHQAQNKGLKVLLNADKAYGLTDANLLMRILRNLVSNAIRYTNQGEVTLSLTTQAESVFIKVADTGIGFEEDLAGQIFEPFHKLQNHQNTEGLGLGLANVKKLCTALGHELSYESEIGRGTCFTIQLKAAANTSLSASSNLPSGIVVLERSILVVDNSAQVCQALCHLLDSWGATTSCCSNTSLLTQHLFDGADAIVLDYHLDDGKTGLHLLKQFNITCPVIFITASNEMGDLDAIQKAGYRYLNKPIKPARLRRVIENSIASQGL